MKRGDEGEDNKREQNGSVRVDMGKEAVGTA